MLTLFIILILAIILGSIIASFLIDYATRKNWQKDDHDA